MSEASAVGSSLESQWRNPSDATSLRMVIGGDIVQKALAAGTGSWYTPVCFSFGWVGYAFLALYNIIGSARLMPDPDTPIKIINLDTGYTRENTSWALGRFVRDEESRIATKSTTPEPESKKTEQGQFRPARRALRITTFRGSVDQKWHDTKVLPMTRVHVVGLLSMLLQFAVAAIPVVLTHEWDTMMITVIGTLLVQLNGLLPQWYSEKVPNRPLRFEKKPDKPPKMKPLALTRGNGSPDVIVVFCPDGCWDLEAFASPQNPRTERIWEHYKTQTQGNMTPPWQAKMRFGFPTGYWMTLVIAVSQSLAWLAVLVNVTASRSNNWYLIVIGLVGVFQNAYAAGMERDVSQLKLRLREESRIEASKVMDGIMDFEVQYPNIGKHLRTEFFNSGLRPDETRWWDGKRDEYNEKRLQDHLGDGSRTAPPENWMEDRAAKNGELAVSETVMSR